MVASGGPALPRALILSGAAALALSACSGASTDTPPTVTVVATVTEFPPATIEPTPLPTVEPSQEPEPSATAYPVLPTVTIAAVESDGSVTVGGFVVGVAEDDRECVFTLAAHSSGNEVTATTVGIENQGTTACGSTAISADELARGTWDVTLTYTYEGVPITSEPVVLEVP